MVGEEREKEEEPVNVDAFGGRTFLKIIMSILVSKIHNHYHLSPINTTRH